MKSGRVLGKQRWWCRVCRYQFTKTNSPGTPDIAKRAAVNLYGHGLSFRTVARLLGTTAQSVLRWGCGYVDQYCTKPEPGEAVVIEVDEMWHFLTCKSNKVWIWKAYNRDTGKLIDWECGGRDAETFRRRLTRLQRWRVRLYCTASFAVYEVTLPPGVHYQGKDHTVALERTTAQQRHWTAALRRHCGGTAAALHRRLQIHGHDRAPGGSVRPSPRQPQRAAGHVSSAHRQFCGFRLNVIVIP